MQDCHPRLSANAKRLSEGKGTQVVPYSRSEKKRTVARSSTPHKLWDLGPLPLVRCARAAGDDTFFVLGAV